MAILLSPETGKSVLTPASGKTFSLAELQAAVGGYIEIHRLPHLGDGNQYMVLNEDGKRLELAVNELATLLLYARGNPMGDYVVGPVVLCTWLELEGGSDAELLAELKTDG